MIRLVLSDVDGTIVPLGDEHPDPRLYEAIDELGRVGIRFGLSTGRDVFELMRIFEGNSSVFACGVLSNGKKVFVDGEMRSLTLLDTEALNRLSELISTYPSSFMCIYPYESSPSNPVYCVRADADAVERMSERYAFEAHMVDEVPDLEVIGATIACEGPQEMLDEIKLRAREVTPVFDVLQPAPHWCDIVPHGLNKGSALQRLMRELGVSKDEVVVFGDAENDLAVLSCVRHSVAVANATPAVKAAARHHIGYAADAAVADALFELARSAREGTVCGFLAD